MYKVGGIRAYAIDARWSLSLMDISSTAGVDNGLPSLTDRSKVIAQQSLALPSKTKQSSADTGRGNCVIWLKHRIGKTINASSG